MFPAQRLDFLFAMLVMITEREREWVVFFEEPTAKVFDQGGFPLFVKSCVHDRFFPA